MLKYFSLILFCLMFSCQPEIKNSGYRIVYKNDKGGNALLGNKEELIQSIRGGAELKIGWGTKGKKHSIEHLSDPIWVAILDESEVIAHLDPQVLSKVDWGNLSASYADSTTLNQEWRVVITTKGEFDAVWINRSSGDIMRRMPQNHTMTWFVKDGVENSTPFFQEE